ncbi:MAG: AAA family ATPase [Proteobacteria bacterium]|nr:AAA family ATPase [Pseudomonadota bacterium]
MNNRKLVVVGGPNGSGKSTFAEEYVKKFNIPYLGADLIAAELCPEDTWSARNKAGRLFSQRLSESIKQGYSLVIESTLSGLSLKRHIENAIEQDYEVVLVFVTLDSPELCIERIKERVAQGGHHVPDIEVIRRFTRARENFWYHYRMLAAKWSLYSNIGDAFDAIAMGAGEDVVVLQPQLLEAFLSGVNIDAKHKA